MAVTVKKVMGVARASIKKLMGVQFDSWEIYASTLYSDANLQAYWRLNGNSTDETANNNDGTDTNMSYSTANGRFYEGADFNGSTARIQVADHASLTLGSSFTINLWAKPDNLPASGALASLVCKYESSATKGGYDLRLYNNAGTQSVGLTTHNGTSAGGGDVTTTLSTTAWNMVTGVYNTTNSRIYVNGAYIGQVANTATPANNTKLLNIGNYGLQGVSENGRYYDGKMDDIAIFNRALSDAEITNIYATDLKKFMGVSNV